MNMSKARFGGVLAALTLVVIQAAYAAEKQPLEFNPADQAAAKAITLKLSDLGAGWKGGPAKVDFSNDTCPTKVSDLVVTGAAKSTFSGDGVFVTSEAEILRTAAMVKADWQRTVANPSFWACGKRELATLEGGKLVSLKKLAFPKLAQYSTRYRLVYDFGKAGSPTLVLMDMILVGQGRSEISLILSAPYSQRTAADGAGRRMATLLLSRTKV